MKIAVILAAHDGLVSLVTGVGVVVNFLVEAFHDIREKCQILKKNHVHFISLAPHIDKNSLDYNYNIKEITKAICETTGGKLVLIPTFSDGHSQRSIWGGVSQWRSASLSAATYITSIQNDYDMFLLFAHDTVFASVRKYLPSLNNLAVIWIPHSLGILFKDEFHCTERIEFEREAIQVMLQSENDFVGYIGQSFRDILLRRYSVTEKRLVPFNNGLYYDSHRYKIPNSYTTKKNVNQLIPPGKKLIFSWGRCVYQKGYDILIPSYRELIKENPGFHLVVLMPTETSDSTYLDRIEKQISTLPENSVTAIYKFDETLPFKILQHPDLKIIVFPSRFEGFPITALEALAFTRKNVKFVYSKIPPLCEVFDMNGCAVVINDLTSKSLCKCMKTAIHNESVSAGNKKTYDIVDNYARGITEVFSKLRKSKDLCKKRKSQL